MVSDDRPHRIDDGNDVFFSKEAAMDYETLKSTDGKCPYCKSWKVGPAGGFAAGPSSSPKLPKPKDNWMCDDCKKLFWPPDK